MVYVKICGLRTPADVAVAVEAGADAVGFVLTDSPRRVAAEQVRRLVGQVPPQVLTVAVFSHEPLERVVREAREAGVAAVQLHGDHPAEAFAALREAAPAGGGLTLVRATSAARAASTAADGAVACGGYGEDLLILDAPEPGSGLSWDWSALRDAPPAGRWMLAGGLSPYNVADAIAVARPWGVDVSSGVEAERGVKDHGLIADFVARAKGPARTTAAR